MRTLLLFRRAPGCGKSTYIKEHNLEQYVLSADTLRLMCQSAQETPAGQMEISPQNDDVVWEMLFKLLEVRMSHGEFTVIDATNSKTVEMNRYKNLAKQYRYRMYVIDMTDLPIEECKRRNAQREWLKRVPEAAIDKMYARFATQKVPSGVTVLPSTTDVMSDLNYCPNDFNQWKKIHVIGDVHGCYTCLSEYLGEMKDDELYIFVGDYLDRGIENVEVFKFLCDVVNNNRKNVILLEGSHERWLNKWGHDEPVQSEEFANYTRPQLFKAGIDKNTARKIYSRVGQCAYFEYDGKRYFVSHGGLSYLPYFLPLQIKEKVKTFENWSKFYPWYEEVMNENYLHHGFEHVEGFVLRDSNNFMFKMKLPYYKHWKFLRGVMQSVQKRGYYENTAKLFTAEDNLFYGWMREQREKDQESFCKKGIIQLRNEFYASQQKS